MAQPVSAPVARRTVLTGAAVGAVALTALATGWIAAEPGMTAALDHPEFGAGRAIGGSIPGAGIAQPARHLPRLTLDA